MIRIVESEREFEGLEQEWHRMEMEPGSSIFSSFDYIHTAWICFKRPADRLLILVSETENRIESIAPLFISRKSRWGVPYREIRFIAEWEGDRPGILTTLPREIAWREFIDFLVNEVRGWDALTLAEQPAVPPGGGEKEWGLDHPSCLWEKTVDATGYHITLQGTWNSYLDGIHAKVKSNVRNRTKRLNSRSGNVFVECVNDPERITESLARFVAMERSGWKKEAGLGVSKDELHRAFYERLLVRLAQRGNTDIYFLKSGKEDVSAAMIFRHRNTLYERHITYAPSYAEYSPGVILRSEILKEIFGGRYEELDMLGMSDNEPGQRHKIDWATGRRETVRINGYRTRSRLLPLILGKKAKRMIRSSGI